MLKYLILISSLIFTTQVANAEFQETDLTRVSKFLKLEHANNALVCHKTGEQRQGQTKICMYNCAGSAATVTVDWNRQCPVTINR